MIEFIKSNVIYYGLFRAVCYIALGVLVYYLAKLLLSKGMSISLNNKKVNIKRKNTVIKLLMNILKYAIIVVVLLALLSIIGVNVTAIVASLGIAGLVVGFALKGTIEDLVSGIFIIIDSQYEVGDFIEVDGFIGEVIELGLKTTKIKRATGEVKIVSNSLIKNLVNYSKQNSVAICEVGIAYEEDVDKAISVLNKLVTKIKKISHVKGSVEVLGVQDLSSSCVILRLTAETDSMEQYGVRREILRLIKNEFDKQSIKIPYPQVEVHNG
ncbi:MAG: mechanosensitive ion channel family protein [Bacilli bacterium]